MRSQEEILSASIVSWMGLGSGLHFTSYKCGYSLTHTQAARNVFSVLLMEIPSRRTSTPRSHAPLPPMDLTRRQERDQVSPTRKAPGMDMTHPSSTVKGGGHALDASASEDACLETCTRHLHGR